MTIRTLFFAFYRELSGADEVMVDLLPGATIRDLIDQLRSRGSSWARLPAEPVVAVNEEYAVLTTQLRDGDEVAFIPPVSGG